jgi:hypothetical protein
MSFFPVDKETVAAIRRSEQLVGQLDEVIVDEANPSRVASGGHRLAANKDWRTRKEKIQNDLHFDVLKLCGNIKHQVSQEEIDYRLLKIAEWLVRKGLPLSWLDGSEPMSFLSKFDESKCVPVPPEKVCAVMGKLLDGIYSERHIRDRLPDEYKEVKKAHTVRDEEVVPHLPDGKVDQLKEGLHGFAESTVPTLEPQPVMEGCLCPKCPNKTTCGII